ncbi:MAG: SecD/SecF family protein translocase subunit [Oceanicaulis sp.]
MGFSLVIVFMILAYGFFGLVATCALIVNVLLLLGALSGLQATLTLPGIAGIILTIGMAVDANVLIFERVREEYRLGRTVANALETGYSRALSAILDANITTFIAAAVLYMIGAGPVRGFAVTLGIGILTSVFTAFVFSRLLIATWLRTRRPKSLAL